MKRTALPRGDEANCPVIPLAFEFDAVVRAYNEQDQLPPDQQINKRMMMALWDRLDAIREQASYLRPSSNLGAAFQIMQANLHMDVLVDTDGADRRQLEAQMVRLFYRAVEYLMQDDERLADARPVQHGRAPQPAFILKDRQTHLAGDEMKETRALTVFDSIPAGCILLPVSETKAAIRICGSVNLH